MHSPRLSRPRRQRATRVLGAVCAGLSVVALGGANAPAGAATPTPTPTASASATPTPSSTPTASPTPVPTRTPTPTPTPTAKPAGPDVASYQHPSGAAISWAAVKKAGESFAFVKASEGASYDNPYYAADAAGARQAGLIVGAYHFGRPGSSASAAAQARHLVSVAGLARTDGTLPLVLDLEDSGGLSPAALQAWTNQFLSTAQALTGRRPVLYTYVSFWRYQMGNDTRFAPYPLWEARYASHWDSIGGWKSPTFWQYTSSATISGVRGAVDRSLFLSSRAALTTLSQGSKASAPTQHIGPPRGVTSLGASILDGVLRAGYAPPVDNGGARVTGSDVQLLRGSTVVKSWHFTSGRGSVVLQGLSSGVTYQLRVRAVNSQGAGSWVVRSLPNVASTHLGLSASNPKPTCGQLDILNARLGSGPSSSAFAGQTLTVSESKAGHPYATVGQIRTDSQGRAALRRTITRSSRYLVTYNASTYHRAGRTGLAVACTPVVQVALPTTVGVNKKFTFHVASTSGDLSGKGALQVFNGRVWVSIAPLGLARSQGALRGTGTHTFTRRGTFTLRFVVAETVGAARAVSKSVRIRVV
ncbi:MAG: glycoside hydrolase, family 25 [Frankiales bacterium]|nr:glycoside hydrolase, family 25 [Frankiales bacterium]